LINDRRIFFFKDTSSLGWIQPSRVTLEQIRETREKYSILSLIISFNELITPANWLQCVFVRPRKIGRVCEIWSIWYTNVVQWGPLSSWRINKNKIVITITKHNHHVTDTEFYVTGKTQKLIQDFLKLP